MTGLTERSRCGIHGEPTSTGRCAACDAEVRVVRRGEIREVLVGGRHVADVTRIPAAQGLATWRAERPMGRPDAGTLVCTGRDLTKVVQIVASKETS